MAEVKGGEKLDAKLREIAKNLKSGATLRVGFLENSTYPDGTQTALVAAVHNFGAPSRGIPPRPFFSNMVKEKNEGWPDAIAKNLVATNYDVDLTLQRVGEGIKGQLQEAIVQFDGVPLKPATIKRKGFDKQLIETSHMLNSVDFDVK